MRGTKRGVVRESGKRGSSEEGSGVHVYAERGAEVTLFREGSSSDNDGNTVEPVSAVRVRGRELTTRSSVPLAQSKTPALKVFTLYMYSTCM